MRLVGLSLTNFRNFVRLTLDFPSPITLLHGDNAQGKTNLLEAVYYVSTSRSPRASVEREVVNWLAFEEPLPFARLVADVLRDSVSSKLEITLVRRSNQSANGNARFSKQVRINGVTKRALDLIGYLPAVLFLPRDIRLVTGAPSVRRRYMDIALCQMDPAYCRWLSDYERVLTQRNALLRELRERNAGRGEERLSFWNEQLVTLGSRLTVRRAALVAALDERARIQHRELSAERERLRIRYESSIIDKLTFPGRQLALGLDEAGAPPVPDAATVSEVFQRGLDSLRRREIAAGTSLIGPHRDEVRFLNAGRDLRAYGSRGQQRTATLAAKLAEVDVMSAKLGEPPILLLDDVLSELDGARRRALLALLANVSQAIVTATDWDDLPAGVRSRARQLRIVEGVVEEVV